ncbi:hypothetical protein [Nitrosomonas sp. Nm34]|uniref:hypothetical protein n=1 Tax=Nitrosomonas sp. Nm34 TaxID=1881055 RepID=UPI001113E5DB|nr:hypothetical protein [Nitrosomonas sp. Nm34]
MQKNNNCPAISSGLWYNLLIVPTAPVIQPYLLHPTRLRERKNQRNFLSPDESKSRRYRQIQNMCALAQHA